MKLIFIFNFYNIYIYIKVCLWNVVEYKYNVVENWHTQVKCECTWVWQYLITVNILILSTNRFSVCAFQWSWSRYSNYSRCYSWMYIVTFHQYHFYKWSVFVVVYYFAVACWQSHLFVQWFKLLNNFFPQFILCVNNHWKQLWAINMMMMMMVFASMWLFCIVFQYNSKGCTIWIQ